MGKIIETKINSFYGGVSEDPRSDSGSEFKITKHFDIYTYPKKLVPYRNNVQDENDGLSENGVKQYGLQYFSYFNEDGYVYGLGRGTLGTGNKVLAKSSLTAANWAATIGNVVLGSTEEVIGDSFGYDGGNRHYFVTTLSVGYVDEISSPAKSIIDGGNLNSTATTAAKGVKVVDGNFYMAYNRHIINASVPGTNLLSIPIEYYITSLESFGNYLAIAAAPNEGYGRSKVFLWDLVSTDVTEQIDWGEGSLMVIGNIDGTLVGVSEENLSNVAGNDKGKMVIREYRGGTATIVKEIEALASGGYLRQSKAIKNGRLRFCAKVPVSASESYEGIWSYGKKNNLYPSALTLDVVEEDADSDGIQSFTQIGNFDFIAHSGDGSIQRTSDTDTFTYTSIYESQIFNAGDSDLDKDLLSAALTFEALPASGQVVLKYKKDEETSYTTLFTETTDNAISRKCVNTAAGANLPSFKEITFRIESTGGAVITGLKFKYEVESSKD